MTNDGIIKYSQQLIAEFSNRKPLYFNGFFVKYEDYIYFISVSHGVTPDMEQSTGVYLILNANAIGISTRVVNIHQWHFVDLYDFNANLHRFEFPTLCERVDFTFCEVNKGTFEKAIGQLPFLLNNAESPSCHHINLNLVKLLERATLPTEDHKYFVAGRKLRYIDDSRAESYMLYFYDMEYIGDYEGLHEFKIMQQTDGDICEGLSGSPVFDENECFIGMALRYRKEDNVLRVFSVDDIVYYLKNNA